ncbi:MAG: tRNA (N6-threonylcarbamoyladenosine(37)-N6)-methyltransferase TrmO [Gammaproteobacteria bacterium RBG_16_57_12]|nr:MAG: tRNA (N6-threonylcarbamoyladenosine(37)-N6)-methyltransferase TrmO [Gammaproteobacteria bacterium RBG_16_57_12]
MKFSFTAIGIIHSCYKEKFAVPRQPGLVMDDQTVLELLPPYNRVEALHDIEGYSHLWIVFVFHANAQDGWKPTVRPPRLGGNRRTGVFASRSPFRPNPIGLSLVELSHIGQENGKILLHLKGADLLDGTPVLDIKPYLPYAEALPQARGGFAAQAPGSDREVIFTHEADTACRVREQAGRTDLRRFIIQLLQQDPRPAYASEDANRIYGARLFDFDLKWTITADRISVIALEPVR